MGQFINSIGQVAKNYKKYDAWEQNQADITARKKAIANNKNLTEQERAELSKRAETVIRAAEIMDAKSEDNCENMEQLTGIVAMVPALAIPMLQVPVTNFAIKKVDDKYSSKIKELSRKTFDENINVVTAAQKELKRVGEKHRKAIEKVNKIAPIAMLGTSFLAAILMILWGNSKQKEASRIGRFQAKQDELKGIENFVAYTPEQIEQAEEIAASIPDEKEKKSLLKMISELKAVRRDRGAYKKWLSEKDPEELNKLKQLDLPKEALENAEKDKELIVNIVKDVNIKAEEYSENLENAYDTFSMLSWLAAAPIGFGLNSILKACKASPKIRNIVSITTPVLVSLGISIHGTFAQKQAARVGRYKARKDLIENPEVLMKYSDEDMESVKDVKADKQKIGFFKKIGQNFKFLGTYFKDKKEYDNYKKTVKKQKEKLQKAFKEIEITDQQKADAKRLQTNVFRSFDEIDEMSQRYSEDIEAGCEIAKQSVSTVWSLGTATAMALAAVAVIKGKLPIVKWGNKIVNWTFDKNSSLKQAFNKLYENLNKKGKDAMQDFQKSLVHGDLESFLTKEGNAEIKESVNVIKNEFAKIASAGAATSITAKKPIKESFNEALGKHLKQTKVAKWLRNLITDILKLKAKSKIEPMLEEEAKAGINVSQIKEVLGLDFNYKNYKTLINTGIIGAVPILSVLFSVPFAFNSWLTNIQKKAGKIGVMQAVNNLDDPKIFADTNA